MGKDKGKQQLPTTPPPPPAAEISAMPREETDAETLARLNTQHGILEGKLNELLKQSALSGLAEIVASAQCSTWLRPLPPPVERPVPNDGRPAGCGTPGRARN